MPRVSGILSIVAGTLFTIAVIAGDLFFYLVIEGFAAGLGGPTDGRVFVILFAALPLLAIGIVAIAGGVAALHRRNWGMALAGSICSLVCFFILGIPSVILVMLSKNEFNHS